MTHKLAKHPTYTRHKGSRLCPITVKYLYFSERTVLDQSQVTCNLSQTIFDNTFTVRSAKCFFFKESHIISHQYWENKTFAAKSGWDYTSFGLINPDSPLNAILLEIWSGTSVGTEQGTAYTAGPTLMIPNHVSHLGFKFWKIMSVHSPMAENNFGGKFHYENSEES